MAQKVATLEFWGPVYSSSTSFFLAVDQGLTTINGIKLSIVISDIVYHILTDLNYVRSRTTLGCHSLWISNNGCIYLCYHEIVLPFFWTKILVNFRKACGWKHQTGILLQKGYHLDVWSLDVARAAQEDTSIVHSLTRTYRTPLTKRTKNQQPTVGHTKNLKVKS